MFCYFKFILSFSPLDGTSNVFLLVTGIYKLKHVKTDVKTSLANTIATFVTYPEQLEIVESLSHPELVFNLNNYR